jgi:hypothetical protein
MAAANASTNGSPTRSQIKKAVAQAEHSKSLWATVNICNGPSFPDTVGIRGQMPSLGFPARLSMDIQLNYFSTTEQRFLPLPVGGQRLLQLGRSSNRLQQGGALFSFNPHAGLFDATVKFIWRRSGKLLGETMHPTTAEHPNAKYGSPAHYSANQCQIP